VPFLGYMTTRLRLRMADPEDGVPTAGVAPDGTCVWNPDFASGLSDPELRFVLAHEVLHPALDFWARLHGRDRMGWNVAHDYAINLILDDFCQTVRGEMARPSVGLFDEAHRGKAAEEIYETVMSQAQGKGKGKGKGKNPGIDGGGMGGDCRGDLSETQEGRQAANGDGVAQKGIDRMWQTTLEAAAQTHEQQMKRQGTLPGSLMQILKDLREPKVTWQHVLAQWVGENAGKEDYTYQRPNRRSESVGEIMPGIVKTGLPDVTVMWDTSGSMNGLAEDILTEVNEIVSEMGLSIRLMICDADVHADVQGISNIEAVLPHIKGGGGSDFNPAFDVLVEENNTSVVLAFTDGYIAVPQLQPDNLKGVLWCLTGGGTTRPTTWGRAITITKDGFAEEV
jgi:predicted metal-dependent peptidase